MGTEAWLFEGASQFATGLLDSEYLGYNLFLFIFCLRDTNSWFQGFSFLITLVHLILISLTLYSYPVPYLYVPQTWYYYVVFLYT
jgi:hypothetical protein